MAEMTLYTMVGSISLVAVVMMVALIKNIYGSNQ